MTRRALLPGLLLLAACGGQMSDQPRSEALESSRFFRDGRASRHLPEGVVPRGHLRLDDHLYEGKVDGKDAGTFPFPVDGAVLRRGRERYDIFCAVCHDRAGTGGGMVVRAGYRQPPSFHTDRLREAAPGYLYNVVHKGFGTMPSYRDVLTPRDIWAVVGYLRALQLSQNARLEDVPPGERWRFE